MPPIGNVTCLSINITTGQSNLGKDDLNALLYIVVTLLFYSMGIIIGIITYLKREQAEMEEDKLFDMYMQLKREPFNLQKKQKVQQMALYLKQLEEQKAAREKAESWTMPDNKQMHSHLYHHQPCNRHMFQHSPCIDCMKTKPTSKTRYSYADGTSHENQRMKRKGSTALLCSLTFGMCEPLLAPDAIKRVTFPSSSTFHGKNVPSSKRRSSVPWSCHNQTQKSVFKHSSPAAAAVHYSHTYRTTSPQEQLIDPKTGNEIKVPFCELLSHEPKHDSVLNMFDKTNIELLELQQFQYQKESVFDNKFTGNNNTVLGRLPCNATTILSPRQEDMHLLTYPSIHRSTSLKLEGHSSKLALHAPLRRKYCLTTSFSDDERYNLTEEIVDEEVGVDNQEGMTEEEVLRGRCQIGTAAVSKDELVFNSLISNCTTNEDVYDCVQSQQQHNAHIEQVEKNQFEGHIQLQQNSGEILSGQMESPIPIQQSIYSYPPLKCDSSLPQQRIHLQRQLKTHHEVNIPKTSPGVNILKIRTEDADVNTSSSDSVLSQSRQNRQSRPCLPWEKNNSQSFDIPDITAADKLGLELKNKSIDKKPVPRSQPERRGALFFTQRTVLQKDLDSPTLNIGDKESSSTGISNKQKKVDWPDSPTPDMLDEINCSIPQHICDNDGGWNVHKTVSSDGISTLTSANNVETLERLPRLTKSQTMDTTQLLQKFQGQK